MQPAHATLPGRKGHTTELTTMCAVDPMGEVVLEAGWTSVFPVMALTFPPTSGPTFEFCGPITQGFP